MVVVAKLPPHREVQGRVQRLGFHEFDRRRSLRHTDGGPIRILSYKTEVRMFSGTFRAYHRWLG
jgi:hypothetical protein